LLLVVDPAPAVAEDEVVAEAALEADAEALPDAVLLAAGDEPVLTGTEDESLEAAVVVEEAQAVAPASSSAPIAPAVSSEPNLRRPAECVLPDMRCPFLDFRPGPPDGPQRSRLSCDARLPPRVPLGSASSPEIRPQRTRRTR
jgi:hypothetical protein